MANKVIQADKLDNGYWQITVIDPVTISSKKITTTEFYRVDNKDIKIKNYVYADADNSYIYFDKSFTPKFIAQLIYLYSIFARDNNIYDNDIIKIDKELNNQGFTLSKYGISKININTVYPCIDIDPYPKDLYYKCLKDDGTIIEEVEIQNKIPYLKDIVNIGQTKISMTLLNFIYITFSGVAIFLIIFLFIYKTDK